MRSEIEVKLRLASLIGALALHGEDMKDFLVGQLATLLWIRQGRRNWHECHELALTHWAASREQQRQWEVSA